MGLDPLSMFAGGTPAGGFSGSSSASGGNDQISSGSSGGRSTRINIDTGGLAIGGVVLLVAFLLFRR